jgi:hypothetical protein
LSESALARPGEMTLDQICQAIPASEYSVRQALRALGIKGRQPLQDRRYTFYPAGSKDKVIKWLESQQN